MLLLCLRVCLFFLESFISVEVRKARSHDFMQIASISLVRYHIVQSFFLKNKHEIDIKSLDICKMNIATKINTK